MTMPNQNQTIAEGPIRQLESEVRFGVVMYGGVSLAIYINGVTDELFRLVRSTAPRIAPINNPTPRLPRSTELCSTEQIYRKVAYLLGDKQLLKAYRAHLLHNTGTDPLAASVAIQAPVKTRFVIDVISGTSAGGLNGLYLGKALANDQDIAPLANMWMKAADFKYLINDKHSLKDLPSLELQDPPRSLLNSERMFLKLLEGFDAMGDTQTEQDEDKASPYVEELDVFATTTDIRGRLVPFKVSDTIVEEKRHRSVFHLQYRAQNELLKSRNDFANACNPFLAFVGRCTSSFPIAFDPMQFSDLKRLLKQHPLAITNEIEDLNRDWQKRLVETLGPTKPATDGSHNLKSEEISRAFGDGGFLDNKPFSYAIDSIASRDPLVPAVRKLIYVEPDPEHPEQHNASADPPNAIDVAFAASVGLPMYETIREDLERVLKRNRKIERMKWIAAEAQNDLAEARRLRTSQRGSNNEARRLPSEKEAHTEYQEAKKKEWDNWTILDMAEYHGPYYLPYRRIRVASATDDIVNWIARAGNLSGDDLIGLRALLRVWRDEIYPDYEKPGGQTLNKFLSAFDIRYRVRRARFISERIDQLIRWMQRCTENREMAVQYGLPSGDDLTLMQRVLSDNDSGFEGTEHRLSSKVNTATVMQMLLSLREEFRIMAAALRSALRVLDEGMQIRSERPESADLDEFRNQAEALTKAPQFLRDIIDVSKHTALSDAANAGSGVSETSVNLVRERAKVEWGNGDHKQKVLALVAKLEAFLGSVRAHQSDRWRVLLDRNNDKAIKQLDFSTVDAETKRVCQSMRERLDTDFRKFDDFDQITFPVLQDTDAAEDSVVDVIRISPDDTNALINQKSDKKVKLAGVKLFHFGAFLSEQWRVNDRLWGRLDGAERLITSLLPGVENEPVRQRLTQEAHEIILQEELWSDSHQEIGKALTDTLIRMKSTQSDDRKTLTVSDETQMVVNRLMENLDKEKLYEFFKHGFNPPGPVPAKETLPMAGRSIRVIGDMLDGIATKRDQDQSRQRNNKGKESRAGKSITAWIASAGSILTLMVSFSLPGGTSAGLFRHFLKYAYGFELFLIATGLVTTKFEISRYGGFLLGMTILVHLGSMLLRKIMSEKTIKADLIAFGGAVILALLVAGLDSLFATEIVATIKCLVLKLFGRAG